MLAVLPRFGIERRHGRLGPDDQVHRLGCQRRQRRLSVELNGFSLAIRLGLAADVAIIGLDEQHLGTRVERLGDAGASLRLGSRIRIEQPKVPPAEWTITAIEPGRGFRLVSRSPGATVEANHWAEPAVAGDRSRVTLSVTFAGFLGRIIGWMMRGLNNRYLAEEAAGLKRRSEERARGG